MATSFWSTVKSFVTGEGSNGTFGSSGTVGYSELETENPTVPLDQQEPPTNEQPTTKTNHSNVPFDPNAYWSSATTDDDTRAFPSWQWSGYGQTSGPLATPYNTILQPPSAITYWRDYGFDTKTLSRVTPTKLIELIADMSPDVSRAIWDYLQFCNPGWEITVTRPGSERPYPKGQSALNTFLNEAIVPNHGDMEIFFDRLFMGAFTRGAIMTELVLNKQGLPVDLATPDPAIARFRKEKDPVRGTVWRLGQINERGEFEPLWERETITYLPLHPFVGNPYGRSPITPALFSIIFLISLMNDIKRVVAQQGYPRIDIEIDLTALASMMPPDQATSPEVFNRWVAAAISDVKRVYACLQPDAAFVHTSIVKVNSNVGVLDVNSLGMVNQIIVRLEAMAMKALKSMPLLMGAVEGMSEANANRQWEVFVAGIKIIQHRAENMLDKQFKLALRAMGIQADVKIRFAELRTAELLRDAMTKQLDISNALSLYLTGAIDFDQYVFQLTGQKPPTSVDEPLFIPKNFIPFGAPNATTAEATAEGSAIPGQEGGATEPIQEDTEDDRSAPRSVEQLVTAEVEQYLRQNLLVSAGFPSTNGTKH